MWVWSELPQSSYIHIAPTACLARQEHMKPLAHTTSRDARGRTVRHSDSVAFACEGVVAPEAMLGHGGEA